MAGYGVRAKRQPRGPAEDPVYTTLEQIVARLGGVPPEPAVNVPTGEILD